MRALSSASGQLWQVWQARAVFSSQALPATVPFRDTTAPVVGVDSMQLRVTITRRDTAARGLTVAFYRLPLAHHKHLKSTNMLERFNEEIKRRTYVVRIFPNTESCLRLVRALAVETHENWLEASRYLNMDDLKEYKKLMLKAAA